MVTFEQLHVSLKEIGDLSGALALLHWDQEVMMRQGSAAARAQQVGTLSGLIHRMTMEKVYPMVCELLERKEGSDFEMQNLARMSRDLQKSARLSEDFVKRSSILTAKALQAWHEAKQKADFKVFEPYLTQIVDLNREKAQLVGFENSPYDALLSFYDEGLTAKFVGRIFDQLKGQLPILFEERPVWEPRQELIEFRNKAYGPEKARSLGEAILTQVGFDLNKGRLDSSVHPFTVSLHPSDVRITAHSKQENIFEYLMSVLHEGGHGMYEQGLKEEYYGLPAGTYASLSIHESISRFWENNVGRSLAFWKYVTPLMKDRMGISTFSAKELFLLNNQSSPSKIRVLADELTYHFHIILRFELEKALIEGELKVEELPDAWAERLNRYLGLKPANDAEGVLQDVHWSNGLLGYFPTYTLGSLYAAQWDAAIREKFPDFEDQITEGDFSVIQTWLKEHICAHGALYTGEELCRRATGKPLEVSSFFNYMKNKQNQARSLRS